MALVTYILGNCSGCKAQNTFGNVDVCGDYVYRGCQRCRYREHVALPPLRKKVIYLDQFFFSRAFRGDEKFIAAAERIARLASLQLLVAPFSSVHEDETHQWEKRADLFKFIKATARGHKFEAAYEVEQTQIVQSFQCWLAGKPAESTINPSDAVDQDVHRWDSYLRIDVGRYMGEVELIRDLKKQSIEGLVNLFDGWRTLQSPFEEDLQAEYQVAGKAYLEFALRVAGGDYMAMFDAPIISQVVQTMLRVIPEEATPEQKLRKCAKFLFSEHFRQLPCQWLNAHMLATLKLMVKNGAYTNRDRALEKLSGVFLDVKHIATYSPYVDAFVMDKHMADLVSRPTVRLEKRYATKVFSLNNWDDFLAWLDQLEGEMSAAHREGLWIAYPKLAQ